MQFLKIEIIIKVASWSFLLLKYSRPKSLLSVLWCKTLVSQLLRPLKQMQNYFLNHIFLLELRVFLLAIFVIRWNDFFPWDRKGSGSLIFVPIWHTHLRPWKHIDFFFFKIVNKDDMAVWRVLLTSSTVITNFKINRVCSFLSTYYLNPALCCHFITLCMLFYIVPSEVGIIILVLQVRKLRTGGGK